MVVLAASICTKGGKAVLSRQFHPMTRTRIEALLASFPKLIPTNSQHTSVETSEVRYVYQPLEDLYILLITNKASNILQDIDTLHLFARVIADMCRTPDEREIHRVAFELLSAFDEIISLGYREQVSLMQVRSILEMESHEEKIQEIITRNKEAEAKEELKRRARQLEMQRREQQRRAAHGGVGGSSSYLGGGISGYAPVQRYESSEPSPVRTASPTPATSRPSAFKSGGMKLGSKTRQAELLSALGSDVLAPEEEMSTPSTPVPTEPPASFKTEARSNIPTVPQESVHVTIKEMLSVSLMHDGGVKSLKLRGDMSLKISDPQFASIQLALSSLSTRFGADLQFQHHPVTMKFAPGTTEKLIAHKDSGKFSVGPALQVLRWYDTRSNESYVPLSITCWPSLSSDGTSSMITEYELNKEDLELYDVIISIPLPSGSDPNVSASSQSSSGTLSTTSHTLDWCVPRVSANETRSGTLEFSIGGDDIQAFFPVNVTFKARGSVTGIDIARAELVDGRDVTFSCERVVVAESYQIVY